MEANRGLRVLARAARSGRRPPTTHTAIYGHGKWPARRLGVRQGAPDPHAKSWPHSRPEHFMRRTAWFFPRRADGSMAGELVVEVGKASRAATTTRSSRTAAGRDGKGTSARRGAAELWVSPLRLMRRRAGSLGRAAGMNAWPPGTASTSLLLPARRCATVSHLIDAALEHAIITRAQCPVRQTVTSPVLDREARELGVVGATRLLHT